ncbi:heavy-metal-associated domain-containing protein, partial [Janthinobacterium agaricidamnosum]|uniref:Heavy-metal-associated domain protein n=1 Tax=Janthinobacterium agaricidamnosum NBRC 102515 = DSM 9628 TaxID=1349767 RepID=W0V4X6_9BURK
MQTAQLSIIGMDHEGCADEVNQVLEAVDGVSTVSVSLIQQAASVCFDEQRASQLQLLTVLNQAGYPAEAA